MPTVSKKPTLAAAFKTTKVQPDPLMGPPSEDKVMIAGHFSKEVKRSLQLVKINADKNLQQVMGEAFNLICEKYGVEGAYSE